VAGSYNTLAYFATELIKVVKSFVDEAREEIKDFT
jgi:hypothetical protein